MSGVSHTSNRRSRAPCACSDANTEESQLLPPRRPITITGWPQHVRNVHQLAHAEHTVQEAECDTEEAALKATTMAAGGETAGKSKRRLFGFAVADASGQCVSIQQIGLAHAEECFLTGAWSKALEP